MKKAEHIVGGRTMGGEVLSKRTKPTWYVREGLLFTAAATSVLTLGLFITLTLGNG